MFITSKNLEILPAISHGFFTRKGGVSNGIYASLNCGLGSGDDKAKVIENRSRVAAKLGTTSDRLCTLYQTHSAEVVTVSKPWRHSKLPRADAMVTNIRGLALGIMTADCVPVLFADSQHNIIGAAHAGWKGAIAGVLEATISAMIALGSKPENIIAAIGPAIGPQSYEVSAEFQETFTQKNKDYAVYFRPAKRSGHAFFDIKSFDRDCIQRMGVEAITTLENDTYLEEDSFFSYRRATHRSEPDYGRQVSAIMLQPVT